MAQKAQQADQLLKASHSEMLERSQTLEAQTKMISLLAGMAHRMQSCATEDELLNVIGRFAPQIFPGVPGGLYLLSNSRNLLRLVITWNSPAGLEVDCAPSECWALRRGQTHIVTSEGSEVICEHVGVKDYSCRPLVAQGETIGLLYLEAAPAVSGPGINRVSAVYDVDIFAESISLAMGNQRLRETFRSQSIRDPLTGLFNRRYLEEALELDLARARRSGRPVSIIMGDADHFKQFNDDFGHDAGDVVLRRIAEVIRANIRKGDLACRYGGEEFVILLHGADAAEAATRAEVIRAEIKAMDVTFRGHALGLATISLGVATFPTHADDGAALITAADKAMYVAKHMGRDRVNVASSSVESHPWWLSTHDPIGALSSLPGLQ